MPRRAADFPPLTDAELAAAFSDPESSRRFPTVLTPLQGADLLQVPLATIYDWSSRGLLRGCASKIGKHLRISRDRFLNAAFNNFQE